MTKLKTDYPCRLKLWLMYKYEKYKRLTVILNKSYNRSSLVMRSYYSAAIYIQRTPVNLIGLAQEKNIKISGLSDYPVTIFY